MSKTRRLLTLGAVVVCLVVIGVRGPGDRPSWLSGSEPAIRLSDIETGPIEALNGWVSIDVDGRGEPLALNVTQRSVTAIVGSERVYESFDATTWREVAVPEVSVAFAARLETGLVVVSHDGTSLLEARAEGWRECRLGIPTGGRFIDAAVDEDSVVLSVELDD